MRSLANLDPPFESAGRLKINRLTHRSGRRRAFHIRAHPSWRTNHNDDDSRQDDITPSTLTTTLITASPASRMQPPLEGTKPASATGRERASERPQVVEDCAPKCAARWQSEETARSSARHHQRFLDLKAANTGRDEQAIINESSAARLSQEKFETALETGNLSGEPARPSSAPISRSSRATTRSAS